MIDIIDLAQMSEHEAERIAGAAVLGEPPITSALRNCEVLLRKYAPRFLTAIAPARESGEKFGRRMTDADKEIIRELRFDQKLSYSKIAEITGWAKSNVRKVCE